MSWNQKQTLKFSLYIVQTVSDDSKYNRTDLIPSTADMTFRSTAVSVAVVTLQECEGVRVRFRTKDINPALLNVDVPLFRPVGLPR